jgi:hypothetical protein
MLGIDDLARREKQQGLTAWSPKFMAEQECQLLLADPREDKYAALVRAVDTQQLVQAIHATTTRLQACLARPLPDDDEAAATRARAKNIIDGLTVVLAGAQEVFMLWQHKARLANRQERARRRNRMLDRVVYETCQFAMPRAPPKPAPPPDNDGGGSGGGGGAQPAGAGLPPEPPDRGDGRADGGAPPDPATPPEPPDQAAASERLAAKVKLLGQIRRGQILPVIFVGDWAIGSQSGGVFSQHEFLRRLAKVAIVIVCSEHCTSKLCPTCGSELAHPQKPTGRTFNGTSFCPSPQCASLGRFFNRDVLAAASIVDRMLCGFLVGGSLGSYEKPVKGIPKDDTHISLFGALTEPRPVAGPW